MTAQVANVQKPTIFPFQYSMMYPPRYPPPIQPANHSKQQQQAPAPPPQTSQRYNELVEAINKIWDQVSTQANSREEETAMVSTLMAELSSLKQRLSKAVFQAESQLAILERATVPAQMQKDIAQLQVESNWLYATVTARSLPFYVRPTTTLTPSGTFARMSRILVLYRTVENEEGRWIQLRHAADPEKKFWFRLVDAVGQVTVGHFDVLPTPQQ